MCSIVGAVLYYSAGLPWTINPLLRSVWKNSIARGRDGRGFVATQVRSRQAANAQQRVIRKSVVRREHFPDIEPHIHLTASMYSMVGNHRAEPTTEFVKDKREDDQQPYSLAGWHVVHNGTIANDKALRILPGLGVPTTIDSAAIVEILCDTQPTLESFAARIRDLKGSFAILAMHESAPGTMFVACNYRPVWYVALKEGYVFASSRDAFPAASNPQMLRPYTVARFDAPGVCSTLPLIEPQKPSHEGAKPTALVDCSGGLDSVVSAAAMKKVGYNLHLIHFQYGSRAEGPEVTAVRNVAAELGAQLTFMPVPIYSKGDSPLLDPDSKVAGGEAGAEFAHEWVPARNTVLLALAVAFAEARGYETIVLGNNLEEAGAYPDNEPEFIARWNDLLPFAVGDGKRMHIEMPVGNMMKHEIVALGHEIDAPMDLTWSCYRAGALHCGTCGPCYMRRKAFAINNLPEVIEYADQTGEDHV